MSADWADAKRLDWMQKHPDHVAWDAEYGVWVVMKIPGRPAYRGLRAAIDRAIDGATDVRGMRMVP